MWLSILRIPELDKTLLAIGSPLKIGVQNNELSPTDSAELLQLPASGGKMEMEIQNPTCYFEIVSSKAFDFHISYYINQNYFKTYFIWNDAKPPRVSTINEHKGN